MLAKLADLNFKAHDGVTRFFKWGMASKGIIVSETQTASLKRILRTYYLCWLLPMLISMTLFGPLLAVLFLPAATIWYLLSVNDVLNVYDDPERMTFTQNLHRLSDALPRWLSRLNLIIVWALTAVCCLWLVTEHIGYRRALRLGMADGDSLGEAMLTVLFFSVGLAVLRVVLTIKNRADRPDVGAAEVRRDPVF